MSIIIGDVIFIFIVCNLININSACLCSSNRKRDCCLIVSSNGGLVHCIY